MVLYSKCAKSYWINIIITMQKIFKMQILMEPEVFLLSIVDKLTENQFGMLFLYMVTAARAVYAK